jgi:hypothetical protein
MNTQETGSLGEREPGFTKLDVALATLLSIVIYTVLWVLGVFVGLFLPTILAAILIVAVYFAPKLIETPQLRPLGIDISASLLAGLLIKLAVLAGMKIPVLPIAAAVIGGVANGIIRYPYLTSYASRKSIKYGLLVLLIASPSVAAALGLYAYYFRIDIPLARLRPPTVIEGWQLVEEDRRFRWVSVRYEKRHSSLIIAASRFVGSPKTEQRYAQEAKAAISAAEPKASRFGSDVVVTGTTQKATETDGSKRYMFRYDFGHKGKDLPMGALVEYLWYCDEFKTNFRASALIEHTPADEYAREVEQMVGSLTCPQAVPSSGEQTLR